ncbi:MAG: pyruvate kinase [SAR202 cluster bacterium]|nr:pyruvate kinase [SAR202 cluster bacterium]
MPMRRPKTKIICTLGPSTSTEETITAMVEAGMSVARLNLSHGNLDQHRESVKIIERVSERLGIPIGTMIDVPGIKYRTGPLGIGMLRLEPGDTITLTSRDIVGTKDLVSVAPEGIHRDAVPGKQVLLDDGLLELRVASVQGQDVVCKVIRGGRLTERRGVATPGTSSTRTFPDPKAIEALAFAAEQNADFVAISNVTAAGDIIAARNILAENGLEACIIAKIERAEALEQLDSILEASDSLMVARGDMGVEVRLARVPVIQKQLIARCNEAGKPAITATQMLESMVLAPAPTRAEVTDVANAVFDGTDAVMLSGETSVGKFPVEAVRMMAEIAVEAEAALPYERMIVEKRDQLQSQTDDAISYDACQTAQQLGAALIVAFTESGSSAGRVSKYRPLPPILALTPSRRVQRHLTLFWGVTPVTIPEVHTMDEFFDVGERMAAMKGGASPGSLVVLVAGVPIGVRGSTNLLRVLIIPPSDQAPKLC